MSEFDVEKEARRFRTEQGRIVGAHPLPAGMELAVADLLTRCRDAAEEADIKAVGSVRTPYQQGSWAQCKQECIAAIHERRRQREEPT